MPTAFTHNQQRARRPEHSGLGRARAHEGVFFAPAWFRRKHTKEERPSEAAPSAPAPPVVAVTQAPPATDAGSDSISNSRQAPTRKPRRTWPQEARRRDDGRRDRDARGEKKTPKRKSSERRTQSQASERRSSQGSARAATRRRQPPKRAPLPAAKRELLVSVDVGEQRVAVLEDDRVAEVYLERPERRSIAGNIYLGTVDNVLPGMEAAFVEIGLEKNGFLYVDEIVVPELEGKRHGKKIQDLIARGQELLVQAVKDPMKTKGARLTTEISLPGRFVVFVPQGEGLGVSRRLPDEERTGSRRSSRSSTSRRAA